MAITYVTDMEVEQDFVMFMLSSDSKPTTGLSIGARIYETDTSTWYDWTGTAWVDTTPNDPTVTVDTEFANDIKLLFGADSDVAFMLRSATLAANTVDATGVLVGTPVSLASPANSMMISNVTADGDIVFFTNTGGNSIEGMRLDSSARSLVVPRVNDAGTPTLAWGDGDTGIYEEQDDRLTISAAGIKRWQIEANLFKAANGFGGALVNETPSATNPTVLARMNDGDSGLVSPGLDIVGLAAGGFEMLRLTESTALANYVAAMFDAPDQVDLTSANGSTWRMLQTQAVNVDWDGGVLITALDGQGLFVSAITNTADQATTVTDVSTVQIAAPIAGTNMTHTRDYSLDLLGSTRFRGSIFAESTPTEGTAGEQLQSAGTGAVPIWAAAASQRENKIIHDEWAIPHDALDTIIKTPVYRFHYVKGMRGTGDFETEYVGVMADEAPWAMHHRGTVVNPVNTLGYMVLGMRALEEENTDLRERVAALEAS